MGERAKWLSRSVFLKLLLWVVISRAGENLTPNVGWILILRPIIYAGH
jgi:hypothetical protein